MRHLIACLAVVLSVSLSGCYRSDLSTSVDRGGHAMVIDTGASGGSGGSGSTSPSGAKSGPPGPGETVITLGPDQALYQVAEERGVSLRWLIERNDLIRRPVAGDRIIVPSHGGMP